jgi:hypothetical protein
VTSILSVLLSPQHIFDVIDELRIVATIFSWTQIEMHQERESEQLIKQHLGGIFHQLFLKPFLQVNVIMTQKFVGLKLLDQFICDDRII